MKAAVQVNMRITTNEAQESAGLKPWDRELTPLPLKIFFPCSLKTLWSLVYLQMPGASSVLTEGAAALREHR